MSRAVPRAHRHFRAAHAGTVFQRRVLKLRCANADEADLMIKSFRSLLRLTSYGDRALYDVCAAAI